MNRRSPKLQASKDIQNDVVHDERYYFKPLVHKYGKRKVEWGHELVNGVYRTKYKIRDTPFRVGMKNWNGSSQDVIDTFYLERPDWKKETYHKPSIEDIEKNLDFMIDFCNPDLILPVYYNELRLGWTSPKS